MDHAMPWNSAVRVVVCLLLGQVLWAGSLPAQTADDDAPTAAAAGLSTTVSWTIGKASSTIDGVPNSGPVTFTWTFDRPVQHGVYLDGTPWVVWQEGLELIAVSPSKKVEDLPNYGTGDDAVIEDGIVDATCINLAFDELPLDQRMEDTASPQHSPWNAGAVWDEQPTALAVGDCIATGRGRRTERFRLPTIVFTAIGVCNIVGQDQTGHYRPPIRMPANLRAALVTPTEVDVTTLPALTVPDPRNWAGDPVTVSLKDVVYPNDADDLLNGPMGHCGLFGGWQGAGNGMLNHDLSGTDDGAYHREISRRHSDCLYTAFDPSVDTAKRQRSLNKFIQGGLDYYYMHCLKYPCWDGKGGINTGMEDMITLTGALLGDAEVIRAMKYQRFLGSEVGMPDVVTDFYEKVPGWVSGEFTRSELNHMLVAATWRSGDYIIRDVGNGAATLEDTYVRIDLASESFKMNEAGLPYVSITESGTESVFQIDPAHTWKQDYYRSYHFRIGAAVRIAGDLKIRRVIHFRDDDGAAWNQTTWANSGYKGGRLHVYPKLTAEEKATLGMTGTLTIGITTRKEAPRTSIWNSTPLNWGDHYKLYSTSPTVAYLSIKLADHFFWMPFYNILPDPTAPGKMLHEESTSYQQVKRHFQMYRDWGSVFWGIFVNQSNLPGWPTGSPGSHSIQALVRHYVLDDEMPSTYCKLFDADDSMWNETGLWVTGWQVVASHGPQGDVAIEADDNYIECRTAGLATLRVTFPAPVDPASVQAGAVTIVGAASGDVSNLVQNLSLSAGGTVLTVTLSAPLPDADTYTVTLTDALTDLSGESVDGNRDIVLKALAGDVDANGTVGPGDVVVTRDAVGKPVDPITARADVNADGAVTGDDLLEVRGRLGNALPGS